MSKRIDDKIFLKIAIATGIIITLVILLLGADLLPAMISSFASIFLFYGFVILGKKDKNIFLIVASYLLIGWEIIYGIAKYILNVPLEAGVVLDWMLLLVFGVALFKIKNIKIISKISSIYIVVISLAVLLVETSLRLLLGAYIWMMILALIYILLTATLYKYLQTMKRPRRRRKK